MPGLAGRHERFVRGLRAFGLLGGHLAAVALLHRLGKVPWLRVRWDDLDRWLAATPPLDATAALLRQAALVAGWWLVVTTFVYVMARVAGARPLARAAAVLVVPVVRRAVDRALVGTVALSTLAAPAAVLAAAPTPPAVDVEAPLVDEGYLPFRRLATPDPRLPSPPADSAAKPVADRGQTGMEVVVRPGDHLWALAERRLEQRLGRSPMDHEVAPYWLTVIAANRDRLRSGDPDLIYPGEVILLPPIDG